MQSQECLDVLYSVLVYIPRIVYYILLYVLVFKALKPDIDTLVTCVYAHACNTCMVCVCVCGSGGVSTLSGFEISFNLASF